MLRGGIMKCGTAGKILVVAVAVMIVAATLFVFAACNPDNTAQAPDGGGNTTPSTPETPDDPETPETPDNPETPETPENPETPETPENPDEPETPENPDEPETPENPDEPETPSEPELTEAEYYEKNIELLKAAIVEQYGKDFGDFADASLKIDESQEIVINEAAGEIYFFGDRIDIFGGSSDLFFVAKFDKNILSETQKNLNSILRSETRSFDINFEYNKTIRSNLSETVYNEFSKYVCNQSYESNGEIITFSEDAQILDISRYIYDYDAHGNTYFQYFIIDNGKVYTARLENAMPPELSDWSIGQIMGYSNNVFKVTEVKPFALFGVD